MIKAARSIALAALIIVATTAGSTITDDKAPPLDASSKFQVGTIKTDVEIRPDVKYEKVFTERLTERLKKKKLLAEPGDATALVIDSKIVQYTPGDLGGRFFSNNGESTVTVVSTFTRGGRGVGTISVQNATGGSMGLYSIGSEAGVIGDAAELLVDDLAKKTKIE